MPGRRSKLSNVQRQAVQQIVRAQAPSGGAPGPAGPPGPPTTDASLLTSGTLPNGRFPATLPAVSGANLTNLDAGALATGTVPLARIAGLTNAQVDAAAAIAWSKLSKAGALPADVGAEAANANIQAHVTSPHAPANAQKNSDITKPEIEAVLTGVIASHSHAVAGSATGVEILVNLTNDTLVQRVTAVGYAWVTANTILLAVAFATDADGQTVETYEAANLQALISNRVAGVGFDVTVFNPHGATGIFRFHVLGVEP